MTAADGRPRAVLVSALALSACGTARIVRQPLPDALDWPPKQPRVRLDSVLEGGRGAQGLMRAEEDLISVMISSLSLFIKRGFPIKVIQTSAPPMGRSQSMLTRILTSLKELGDWLDDLKRLGRIHRSRA